jgi:ParB/RepB/Spo0J family partition protein
MKISISNIKPGSKQIRTSWDISKLEELTASIKEQKGVIVPIKVRPIENGQFEVVYGHRRLEASKKAGLEEIECLVMETGDTDVLVQGLIENVMREDMTPMDTARALQRLIETTGWSQREIERQGIMSHVQVSHLLNLLSIPKDIQELVVSAQGSEVPEGKITEGQIRAIRENLSGVNSVNTPTLDSLAKKVAKEGLTVPQIKQVAEEVKEARLYRGQAGVDAVISRPFNTRPVDYTPMSRTSEFDMGKLSQTPVETEFSWYNQDVVNRMDVFFDKDIPEGINMLVNSMQDRRVARRILDHARKSISRWLPVIDEAIEKIDDVLGEPDVR